MTLARTGAGSRMRMVHMGDPKKELLDEVGNVPDGIVMMNRILVAIYRRPEKTAGGIFLTDKAKDEDVWQGKVGLVIAMGPMAYVDDDNSKFNGENVSVGDWVWFRPSDGQHCEVNGVPCRVFQEGGIIGKVPTPDMIF